MTLRTMRSVIWNVCWKNNITLTMYYFIREGTTQCSLSDFIVRLSMGLHVHEYK